MRVGKARLARISRDAMLDGELGDVARSVAAVVTAVQATRLRSLMARGAERELTRRANGIRRRLRELTTSLEFDLLSAALRRVTDDLELASEAFAKAGMAASYLAAKWDQLRETDEDKGKAS